MLLNGPRQNLHVHVVESLGARIVHGDVDAGAILSVDELEAEFGASRTALREALKVLGAKGLVGARPRYGTYVEQRGNWNLFDLDVMRWRGSGPFDERLLHDLAQLRRILEPGAADLAAINRRPEDLERIMASLEGLGRHDATGVEAHTDADIEFHASILRATGNELLASMRVILEPALRVRNRLVYHLTTEDPYDAHAAVAHAIRDGNARAARHAMEALLEDAERSGQEVLARTTSARSGHSTQP